MKNERIKIIAFYVLMILVIVKFVAVPLNNLVKEKKGILNEYIETYRIKALLIERHKSEQKTKEAKLVKTEGVLLASIYQKDSPYALIQSEVLQWIIGSAEGHGLTVLNFEFPRAVVAENISEVPVLVRLRGDPKAVVNLLKDIEEWEKALRFRNFQVSRGRGDFVFAMTLSAFRAEE